MKMMQKTIGTIKLLCAAALTIGLSTCAMAEEELLVDCSDWDSVKANLEMGRSVKLTQSVTVNHSRVSPRKQTTLDLNGQTIHHTNAERLFEVQNAQFTIKDSAGGGRINCEGGQWVYQGYCLLMHSNAKVTIDGGTISGYTIKSNCESSYGAAICCELNATLTINNLNIENCSAKYGGAICVGFYGVGTCVINNCNIKNCSASENGGGIFVNCNSMLVINNGLIENCTATRNGGALRVDNGKVNIYGGNFTGNKSNWGGAISLATAINVYGGTFSGNKADVGMPFIDAGEQSTYARLYGCTVIGYDPLGPDPQSGEVNSVLADGASITRIGDRYIITCL